MVKIMFHRSVVLLMLIAAALVMKVDVEAAALVPTASVRIRNEIPGTGVVGVHCYSKNDDLHQQYLASWGAPYYFSFKPNFWGSTDFWCRFTYDPDRLWNQFDVWAAPGFFGRRKMPCEQCLWVVRRDGFYRAPEGPGIPELFVLPWRHV